MDFFTSLLRLSLCLLTLLSIFCVAKISDHISDDTTWGKDLRNLTEYPMQYYIMYFFITNIIYLRILDP